MSLLHDGEIRGVDGVIYLELGSGSVDRLDIYTQNDDDPHTDGVTFSPDQVDELLRDLHAARGKMPGDSRRFGFREEESRKIQEIYAKTMGYFWHPCPLCTRPFGGHEWYDIGDLSSTIYPDLEKPGEGQGICPVCTAQGRGHRIIFFRKEAPHGKDSN